MPSPKSGNAPAAVGPAGPKKALDADKAKPGEMDRPENSGKGGSGPGGGEKPHKPPKTQEEKEEKKHWIEIELFFKKSGLPVVGEPYKIVLPDGVTAAEGTLDEKGFARVDGIDAGQCTVNFPNRDKTVWKQK